ncbi:MAG: GNAT family N-acetyltransferase [Microbacteriaceae bacterium]|nr:GNAT family N-acetyltransferase [Microbacteriaceae bacterium]
MKLDLYCPNKYAAKLGEYVMPDATYTDAPAQVLFSAQADASLHPVVILDGADELVGFFCVQTGPGPARYGYYNDNYALVRSFSVDQRYRGRGYASRTMEQLFEFVNERICERVSNLVLAVNEQNLAAQKAYARAGFAIVQSGVAGRVGDVYIMEKIKPAPITIEPCPSIAERVGAQLSAGFGAFLDRSVLQNQQVCA